LEIVLRELGGAASAGKGIFNSLRFGVKRFVEEYDIFILLPVKTEGLGTEYTVADTEGGQPCTDGNGMPKLKR
jgi:hypothetical protein